jgi:hypothetical protein
MTDAGVVERQPAGSPESWAAVAEAWAAYRGVERCAEAEMRERHPRLYEDVAAPVAAGEREG